MKDTIKFLAPEVRHVNSTLINLNQSSVGATQKLILSLSYKPLDWCRTTTLLAKCTSKIIPI
jgi:hypothetical protein